MKLIIVVLKITTVLIIIVVIIIMTIHPLDDNVERITICDTEGDHTHTSVIRADPSSSSSTKLRIVGALGYWARRFAMNYPGPRSLSQKCGLGHRV